MRSTNPVHSPATAERDVYLCPVCHKQQRTKGWLKWHLCKKHCPYGQEFSRTPADDPDKYIKGKYGHMVRR
jgi:RNA polymerase subunit RPABC4/transcription elongation factor Spt4